MVIPFLPIFLLQIGVHEHAEFWSGLIYSLSCLAGAISAPYWGALGDKYGRKPMMIRAGFVLFAVYFLTAFAHNPIELLALRVLQGLLSGFIPAAVALVATNTPENKVGYALAMLSAATSTGGIVGPLVGGGIAKLFNNRVAFASGGIIVLIATLMVMFWITEEKFVARKDNSGMVQTIKTAGRNKPLMLALLLNVVVTFSVMTIEPVLSLYVVQLGGDIKNASLVSGIVFSLTGIAAVVFAPVWGRTADRIGFKIVLIIGLLGGGIGNLLQVPFHTVLGFSVVRFLYGIFFSAVYPAINGLVVLATDNEFRGRAFGLNQTANQIGSTLGPLLGGWIAGLFSVHSVFWVTGIFLLLATGLSFAVNRNKERSGIQEDSSQLST